MMKKEPWHIGKLFELFRYFIIEDIVLTRKWRGKRQRGVPEEEKARLPVPQDHTSKTDKFDNDFVDWELSGPTSSFEKLKKGLCGDAKLCFDKARHSCLVWQIPIRNQQHKETLSAWKVKKNTVQHEVNGSSKKGSKKPVTKSFNYKKCCKKGGQYKIQFEKIASSDPFTDFIICSIKPCGDKNYARTHFSRIDLKIQTSNLLQW